MRTAFSFVQRFVAPFVFAQKIFSYDEENLPHQIRKLRLEKLLGRLLFSFCFIKRLLELSNEVFGKNTYQELKYLHSTNSLVAYEIVR